MNGGLLDWIGDHELAGFIVTIFIFFVAMELIFS